MKEENDLIRTTLQVPRSLWKVIKNIAFDQKKSTNDLVVVALREKYGNAVTQS